MPYSGRQGFSYPFFLGLISILFSFGKGLIWFSPGLLLPVRRALKTAGQSSTACICSGRFSSPAWS